MVNLWLLDLATYDNAKHWILRNTQWKDGTMTHVCASACAGLMAAIVSTPADVVKTRIMDQLRHTHDNNNGYVRDPKKLFRELFNPPTTWASGPNLPGCPQLLLSQTSG